MLHAGECRDEGGRMQNKCAVEKKGMRRWKYRCVCVNLGHCYRIGRRTSSTWFFLGITLVAMRASSRWRRWRGY